MIFVYNLLYSFLLFFVYLLVQLERKLNAYGETRRVHAAQNVKIFFKKV